MYQRISQIKASSRKELRGHYGMIIAAIFVTLLIILVINIPFRRMLFRGILWLSWSVATCLILEDPDKRVIQALRESRKLLKGKKRRRFLLFLSFIGLLILSFFTFFIALLWVIPYIRQSMISFYLDLQSAQEQPA